MYENSIKFYQSVNAWCCMSVTDVEKVSKDCCLLDHFIVQYSEDRYVNNEFIFQSSHSMQWNLQKEFFLVGGGETDWPTDVNPIENLWRTIKKRLRKYYPLNHEGLTWAMSEVWASLTLEDCHRLGGTTNGNYSKCKNVLQQSINVQIIILLLMY